MSTRIRKPAAELKVGDWIIHNGACLEVKHVQPIRKATRPLVLVVFDEDDIDRLPAGQQVNLAMAAEIAETKAHAAREAIADGLERLARLYRDRRMPMPSYNTLDLHERVTSEAELRLAAEFLGVEVQQRRTGSLLLDWESAPWSADGARVTLSLRADADETPAEAEGPSADTAASGEGAAAPSTVTSLAVDGTAPAGVAAPAGAPLDATRVDHDAAAVLAEVRATGRATVQPLHIGRSFAGNEIESICPCGLAPCGLVDSTKVDPGCEQHHGPQTMRQIHAADRCTGGTR